MLRAGARGPGRRRANRAEPGRRRGASTTRASTAAGRPRGRLDVLDAKKGAGRGVEALPPVVGRWEELIADVVYDS